MPDFKRIGVIALAAALTIQFTLHRANAQAVIGVPVVETVIIGGIVYYVWQNWQGEEQRSTTYPMLEDPEEEIERMGSNATQGRVVVADSASEAQIKCEQYADYRRTDTPENLGNGRWKCRYS